MAAKLFSLQLCHLSFLQQGCNVAAPAAADDDDDDYDDDNDDDNDDDDEEEEEEEEGLGEAVELPSIFRIILRLLSRSRSRVVTFTAIRLRGPGFKPRPGQKFENENFLFSSPQRW